MRDTSYLDPLCNTGDGVFIVDADRRIIRWNKGAEKILKYSAKEVLNQDCCQVLSGKLPSDRILCSQNCKIHRNALRGVPQKSFDLLTRTNGGGPICLNVSVVASAGGEDPFVAHILRDVTQARKTEQALKRFLKDLGAADPDSQAVPKARPWGRKTAAPAPAFEKPAPALSAREVEVLKLLAEGTSTKGLAEKLNISHFTARNHIQNILGKLGLHSKAQAVSYAFRKGIL